MNASWPMVIGALLAGTVGGFMIPVRPEIRDVPALSASRTTEPAKNTVATPAKAEGNADVRKIPLTEQYSENSESATESKATTVQEATPCERQAWPNQSPDCLDRSAKVTPAETVPARRVDPATGIAGKSEPKTDKPEVKTEAKTAAAPEQETIAAPKPEPAPSQQKVVSSPPARAERSALPAQAEAQPARETREQRTGRPAQTEQANAPRMDEPRVQTTVESSGQLPERPRRSSRRVNPDDLDDGIPTKIYLRGPDGRLYLAPEYRPSGRAVYIMR